CIVFLASGKGGGPDRRRTEQGRLAQRESASFTPKRSLVRSQYRPREERAPGSDVRGSFLFGRATHSALWSAPHHPRPRGRAVGTAPHRARTHERETGGVSVDLGILRACRSRTKRKARRARCPSSCGAACLV